MYDYHTHSNFSEDCFIPMEEMIDSAAQKGVAQMAITDHYDADYPDPEYPFDLDFDAYHEKLHQVCKQRHGTGLKVVKGLEIGIQHGETLQKCEAAVKAFPYDFIIGSFHCAYGHDLYKQYFAKRSAPEGIADFYRYMLLCLKDFQNFDVLGHLNVIDRYVDAIPDYAPYMEDIEKILRILIENEKGIELNTSSFRYGMGNRTTPSKEILALYKRLGGQIITIGSDAHRPQDIGANYSDAMEILRSHDFRYLCTFENRVASFIKLQ